MSIAIVQPAEAEGGDLVFTQPKFHFGQTLEDEKNRRGFVIGMDFDGNWNYTLFYTELIVPSKPLKENELALLTQSTIATPARPVLEQG